MTDYTVATTADEDRGVRLTIFQIGDCECESPRDWDNLGTMVCWHRRYDLGDKHDFADPGEFEEWWGEQRGIRLPLYLIDHSGIAMRTTDFNDRWDSGQVGWIYLTQEKIDQEYDQEYPRAVIERMAGDNIRDDQFTSLQETAAKQAMVSEVETYSMYLEGRVYGFVLERTHVTTYPMGIETRHELSSPEEIDSCWGFFGEDWDASISHYLSDEHRPLVAQLG